MIKRVIPLLILLLSIFCISSYNPKSEQDDGEGIKIDTSKAVFILDGKRATAMETIFNPSYDSTMICVGGTADIKKSIFYYGEKGRHSLFIFETIKQNENISDN